MKNHARLNKSQWVRSQPATIGAKELVAKAAKEGIEISLAQVYTARSTARTKVRSTLALAKENGSGNPKQLFIRLAVRLGTDEAQRLLNTLGNQGGLPVGL